MNERREALAYSRLENDAEFVARTRTKYPWWHQYTSVLPKGDALDDDIWWSFGLQRKLVVIYP